MISIDSQIKYSTKTHLKRLRLFIYLLLISVSSVNATLPAGPIIVSARPDTNAIRIGEQFNIVLKVNTPTGVTLNFPVFPDTLGGIEIVSRGKVDTIIAKDKSNVTYSQSLKVTSFDSGFYAVEPFHFTGINKETGITDTFSTEAFLISVKTIPVDTTQAIKDIKAPLEVSYTWQEISLIVSSVLFGLLLLWLLIRYFKNRKRPEAPAKPKAPTRPAYEIALEALKKTEEEKLWQQGFYKQYHSLVSDTLREYIEKLYGINALELTSDETLERMRRQRLPEGVLNKLDYVLRTADPVKFAKLVPMADENEKSMKYAYDFINATRPVIEADMNRKENEA